MTPTLASPPHESDSAARDVIATTCPPPPPGYAIATLPDGRFLPMSLLLLSHEDAAEVSYGLFGPPTKNTTVRSMPPGLKQLRTNRAMLAKEAEEAWDKP